MPWFKKWWQEKFGNRSKNESCCRDGNKCVRGTENEQTFSDTKSRMKLSRESICESYNKNAGTSSLDSCSQSTSNGSVQTHQKSIQSAPIACKLRQQAKDLESLISGSVSSNHSINVKEDEVAGSSGSLGKVLDPDEFFENPDDIRLYKEENAFLDEYIIIDIKEVEAISRQIPTVGGQKDKKPKPIKYQTTEFTMKVNVKRQPLVMARTSYLTNEYEYGLYYGTPAFTLSQFPQSFYYRTFNENVVYGSSYRGRSKRRRKSAEPEKTPSIEILDEKVDALINELPKPKKTFSIQKIFGLTDDGDIIVNVDHITEEKGRGLFMTKQISFYRSIETGDAISEKRCIRKSILAILKEFFYQLCKCNLSDTRFNVSLPL